MAHKYELQCWSCGGSLQENKGSYVQCRSCGATWNEVPKLSETSIVLESDYAKRNLESFDKRSYSPSPGARRSARKARELQREEPSPK